ncbi:DNA internalization-related competence protein ComEC/Rec2 [Staphylococcus cohnii subsp. cohnii]|uniref:DNA internalization-related competence protein ComEC/Rec2 n=2 Tax=Staphylococcus TaxID=1279 RepID=UPI0028128B54|nr:DNA internalization-related competence protein ComEC/Rec2 [Staphylococcus cohnii]
MKRKSFSLIHFIMIVIISLSSFMMFQNDLRSEKEYHSSMINKVFQGKAKFITKPNLEHRILKGKIKIGKKLYTYIYNIHASKNIEIKNVSEFLFQKTCKLHGQFRTLKNDTRPNLIFIIQNIHLSSCYEDTSTFSDTLNKHKAFIYEKMKQWKIAFPEKTIALITGDTSLMKKDELDTIKKIGIAHLLAISGTHIAIIIAIICYILNRIKCPLFLTKLILIILLPIYCMYTNMSPSAVRAIFMSLLIFIFPKYIIKNSMNILGFLFIFLTFLNPSLIYHVGFQLSFLITFSILFASPLLKNLGIVQSLCYITWIAQLSSFILSCIHFHQIQWIGLISNIFFVPFYSFILFPFVIFLTFIIHLPIKPLFIINLYNQLIVLHDKVVGFFDKLNFYQWYIPNLNNLQITIICLISFLCLVLFVHKCYKFMIISLIALYIVSTILPQVRDYQLTMLDVGQGDALLFETKLHESLLIDTGGNFNSTQNFANHSISKYHILPTLKRHNIKKIDYVVVTHPHLDHIGELDYLTKSLKIKNIIINANSFKIKELNHLKNTCLKKDIKLIDFKNKLQFFMNKAKVNLLDATISNSDNLNEQSIIILIQYKSYKILLMGDATNNNEENLIHKYHLYNVDILKVGHHGSRTSTSNNLLKAIRPKIALISVGEKNKYRLPNPQIINRLKSFDIKIFQTNINGEVNILFKNQIEIHSQFN